MRDQDGDAQDDASDHQPSLPSVPISAIIADLIRYEAGGKVLLVGVYSDGITLPTVPFPVPMLYCYVELVANCNVDHKYVIGIEGPDGAVITSRSGTLHAVHTGQDTMLYPIVLPFQPFQFMQDGQHWLYMELDDNERVRVRPITIQVAEQARETRH